MSLENVRHRILHQQERTRLTSHIWPPSLPFLSDLLCSQPPPISSHSSLSSLLFLSTQVWNHSTVILGSANASSSAYDDYADYFIVDDKVLFLEQGRALPIQVLQTKSASRHCDNLAAIKCSTFICIWKKCRAGGLLLMVEVCFVCVCVCVCVCEINSQDFANHIWKDAC